MSAFLSDEWIEELRAAAARQAVPDDLRLVIQQVVHADGDEVAFAVRFGDGTLSVEPGHAPDADVVFTQDVATAAAVAQGVESAQAAFMAGRLRVGGSLHLLVDRAPALAVLDDVFGSVRATTTW